MLPVCAGPTLELGRRRTGGSVPVRGGSTDPGGRCGEAVAPAGGVPGDPGCSGEGDRGCAAALPGALDPGVVAAAADPAATAAPGAATDFVPAPAAAAAEAGAGIP